MRSMDFGTGRSIEHAVGRVASRYAPVLVRTAENSAIAIGQALDSGAEGVIVPLIETDEQAAAAVAAARFPPQGLRSAGGVRPLGANFAQLLCCRQMHRTVVGVMIETQRGVHNAAAIANTPGVDFVLIGTGDLAISLGGFPARRSAPRAGLPDRAGSLQGARIPCAIYTGSTDAAIKRRREGYALVVVANDIDVVSRGFSSAMTQFTQDAGKSANSADGKGGDACPQPC